MVSIIRVDNICSKLGMKKLGIINKPVWMLSDNQYGIEYQADKVISFKNDCGERIYDFDVPIELHKVLDMIHEVENEEKAIEEDKKDEQETSEKQDTLPAQKENTELPEFLTPALLSKWATMSTTDRILLFQKTPKQQIYQVAIGKNETGKMEFASYVKGNYMFKEANAAFLFDWYLDKLVLNVCPTGVSATGILFCWFKEYNKYLSRPATGYQETNKKVDVEAAKKGATTDAIKKGLSLFGFNSDVYSGEA